MNVKIANIKVRCMIFYKKYFLFYNRLVYSCNGVAYSCD